MADIALVSANFREIRTHWELNSAWQEKINPVKSEMQAQLWPEISEAFMSYS